MKHFNNMEHDKAQQYSLQKFAPLIILFLIILGLTLVRQGLSGWAMTGAMSDFMGFFFIIFGSFKLLKLKDFAQAYAEYDIIARKSIYYGYAYPFIELGLGIAYLARWNPTATNIITLVIMLVSAYGVYAELRKGKTIICACLGTVFKVPMTYVTLFEDLLMAVMAFVMLVQE